MRKFILNLIIFSSILLLIPISIFTIDPYDYYEHPFKISLNRMDVFRRNNVADWALVEVSKIDKDLKQDIKAVSIGDSRSRLFISGGHQVGWTNRICGIDMDVLDLSFGGANIDESFSILESQLKYLPSLKKIIISLPVDGLISPKHELNRIKESSFNHSFPGIKYLTNINLLINVIEKKDEILKDKTNANEKHLKSIESVAILNERIRKSKIDHDELKKRNRVIVFKRNRFRQNQAKKDFTFLNNKNDNSQDEKIRQSFLRKFQLGSRSLFDKNLSNVESKLSVLSKEHEIIIVIPTYDNFLLEAINEKSRSDYNYYVRMLKKLPYEVINLQEISNEFLFADPVHGNYMNGSLIHKIMHKHPIVNNYN